MGSGARDARTPACPRSSRVKRFSSASQTMTFEGEKKKKLKEKRKKLKEKTPKSAAPKLKILF
jgi:hypothetical protein